MPQPREVYVNSSSGLMTFSWPYGLLISNESDYEEVDRLDIQEYNQWRMTYRLPTLEAGDTVDCLLIGWWETNGRYNDADNVARQDFLVDHFAL